MGIITGRLTPSDPKRGARHAGLTAVMHCRVSPWCSEALSAVTAQRAGIIVKSRTASPRFTRCSLRPAYPAQQ